MGVLVGVRSRRRHDENMRGPGQPLAAGRSDPVRVDRLARGVEDRDPLEADLDAGPVDHALAVRS
jgi:hypothetical protein